MFHRCTVKSISWLPEKFSWLPEKKRKKEFLDKLKGIACFKVRPNIPVGATFMVLNKHKGIVDAYYCTAYNSWIRWGSTLTKGDGLVQTYTDRQLEVHLTLLVKEANRKNAIDLIDESCCLEWIAPK